MKHLNSLISIEIKEATKGLPLYLGGPGVNYTNAGFGYAVNITLIHGLGFDVVNEAVASHSLALLVQRGSGHGPIGSWSGVTGYIDVMRDPVGRVADEDFDPVAYAAFNELKEECGFDPDVIGQIQLYLGERFVVPSEFVGGPLNVMPILAVFGGEVCPRVTIAPNELSDFKWVAICDIPETLGSGHGYVKNVLPRALIAPWANYEQ